MPRPIIIDTDPGQDDAIAILLAFASPELQVLGLTTVAGNVPLWRTTENTLKLVELAGRREVPVFAGCPRPLLRDPVTAEHAHGETGLNGANLPDATTPTQSTHAVAWLIDTLTHASEPVTLCPLGPLTNIATALIQAPHIVSNIESIVAMAGAVRTHGNVTPAAEFNVFADPHAADVVFSAGCPLTLMPLDVTHRALITQERLEAFKSLPSPVSEACHGMLSFYFRPNTTRFATPGSPLHDPCVIAYLLEPEIFEGKSVNVQVETSSPLTLGMTLADWWGKSPPNAHVMQTLDADRFFALILERLATLDTG